MARAICGLHSRCRWAVTGTPIQNRLGDLATLLKFIRVYPYNDPKCFDNDITRLWKSGEDDEAVKRLKWLSACLLLRRPKGTINIPPRRDVKCAVDFSAAERAVYDKVLQQAITKIDDALLQNSEVSRSGVYVNVLQQIESLRLVCDLGLHYDARHNKPMALPSTDAVEWSIVAQRTFNAQQEMGPIICSQCFSTIDLSEILLQDMNAQQEPLFARCLQFICGDCVQRSRNANHPMVCGHIPACPIAGVSLTSSALEDIQGHSFPLAETLSLALPSKVKALVTDLRSLPSDVKW